MKIFFPVLLAACALSASAAPIQWTTVSGGNGHWYDVVTSPDPQTHDYWTWDLATADASSRGGYLATLTSLDEDSFVFSLVDDPSYWVLDGAGNEEGPRFGLSDPAGNFQWAWTTGETFSYAHWAGGEPNSEGTEDSGVFFDNHLPNVGGNRPPADEWNNVSKSSGMYAYVIEYDSEPTTTPEPGTLVMLAGGGLLMLARRKFAR
jgi:hypothetical protein